MDISDPHAYFESLRALGKSTWDPDGRGEVDHAWSLRDPEQIIGVTLKPRTEEPRNPFWGYDPANDAETEKQDAAKFSLDPADIELYNPGQTDADPPRAFTLTFPMGVRFDSTDTLLVTWDAYYTELWSENLGTVGHWKHYQLYRGTGMKDRHTYVGPKVHFNKRNQGGTDSGAKSVGTLGITLIPSNPDDLDKGPFPRAGHIWEKSDVRPANNSTDPPKNTGEGGIVPGMAYPEEGRYHVQRSTWHRYWLEIHMSVRGLDDRFTSWRNTPEYLLAPEEDRLAFETGIWTMVSLWFADETRGPIRVLYGVPWRIPAQATMVTQYGFEMDTSASYCNTTGSSPSYMKGAQSGVAIRGYPCVGYWRNVIGLLNYASPGRAAGVAEHDEVIFQRPGAAAVTPPTPMPPSAHAYFDSLVASPYHESSYGLRTQEEIDSIKTEGLDSNRLQPGMIKTVYDPSMDAAKFAIDCLGTTTGGELAWTAPAMWFPLGPRTGHGTMLITFDFLFDDKWRWVEDGYIGRHKMWWIQFGESMGWNMFDTEWRKTTLNRPEMLGEAYLHCSKAGDTWMVPGESWQQGETIMPRLGQFYFKEYQWTRCWYFVEGNLSGGIGGEPLYISVWFADPEQGVVQTYDRTAMYSSEHGLKWFKIGYDTSSSYPKNPYMESWQRNVVIMKDIPLAEIPPLLVAP